MIPIAPPISTFPAPSVNAITSSPTVTYLLSINDNGSGMQTAGQFAIYATDTTVDGNGGLATYGVDLTGFTSVTNLGPKVAFDDGTGSGNLIDVGFTDSTVRSGKNMDPISGGQETLVASEAGPVTLVYGFGQTSGNLNNYTSANSTGSGGRVQVAYKAPLLLAVGTFTNPLALKFNAVTTNDIANVFVTNSGTSTAAANVILASNSSPLVLLPPSITLTPATNRQILPQLTNSNFLAGAHQGVFSNGLNTLSPAPSFIHKINNGTGDSQDYVQIGGLSPATNAPEIYALKLNDNGTYLDPTLAANSSVLSGLINDMNSFNSANFGASIISPVSGPFASIFPGYDLLVTIPTSYLNTLPIPAGGTQLDFGFNFANLAQFTGFTQSDSTDNFTVTDIGVIPEPTGLGLLAAGGLGLLTRRRSATRQSHPASTLPASRL